ncbi:MAG: Lar family restriction alleviation protein, partial [Candidatus Marinimicrobia bacterium]|nr:Lar family restriction alleviation protein [Candidatus Neomarinimicrobiota bacterium]
MNEELRECPFCGKDAVIRCDFCDEENYNIYFIECLGCDTMTSVHTEEKFAIKAWNIRYETKHETVEELREAYESWDEDSNWTPEEME